MSALPPEIEVKGLRAYEQARAFETLQRRRLPLIYAGLAMLFVVGGMVMQRTEHRVLGDVNFAAGVILAFWFWWSWRRYEARHGENLRLLARLEREYGDALPWVQVEKHFAALDKLRGELAEEDEPIPEEPTRDRSDSRPDPPA
jgi:hypothetical protein